jgi:phospholipase C
MRRVLLGACLTALSAFASGFFACSQSNSTPPPPAMDAAPLDAGADVWPPTPPEWDRPITRPDDMTAQTNRAACMYQRGALPGETLGPSVPVDTDMPIQTIVVMIQENHSFDQYFSHLNKFAQRTDIESAPDNTTNPTVVGGEGGTPEAGAGEGGSEAGPPDAGVHAYQHGPHLCFYDTNHEWSGSHLEYDNGKNDGFYQANEDEGPGSGVPDAAPPGAGSGDRALWWYDERDIPFYYQLASTFGIADHYHCSLLGPTWPNRMFAYSATSFGMTFNIFPDISKDTFPDNDIIVFDELEKRHASWGIYTDSSPGPAVALGPGIATRYGRDPVKSTVKFFKEAMAGTLPNVVYIEGMLGAEGPAGNDEHPPADIQIGQKYVSDIVQALMASPQWPHMAFFLTYDEHGGLYDHVPPPAACPPDNIAPILARGDTTPGVFDRLGFRVPLLVVSPYAKRAFVSHQVYDHTSITRFIEAKFRIPALSARDANALPPTEMFDFQNPPFVTPPTLMVPPVDPTEAQRCVTSYTP